MHFFFIAIVQVMVVVMSSAMPLPDDSMVKPGDVVRAKPKDYLYPLPKTSQIGAHPVVVLSHPDKNGYVKVTTVSHTHPLNPPTKPASTYGLPIDPVKGESHVNVAGPDMIHVNKLKTGIKNQLQPHHFQALKAEIEKNCPGALHKRAQASPNPCDRKSMQEAAQRKHQEDMAARQAAQNNKFKGKIQGKHTRPSHPSHSPQYHPASHGRRPSGSHGAPASSNHIHPRSH